MDVNALPAYDQSENETGCCPRFHPEPWDRQTLHFVAKPFVRASTIGMFHVPLNLSHVFSKTMESIRRAHAETNQFVVLSHDTSAWHGEHLFAVADNVPGADMVRLTGEFLTRVFDGPFSAAPTWGQMMQDYVAAQGRRLDTLYFYYTTCPRCAQHYGHNYVVAVAKVA